MEAAPQPAASIGRAITFAEVMASYRAVLGPWLRRIGPAYIGLAVLFLAVNVPAWIVSYLSLSAMAAFDWQSMATYGLLGSLARLVGAVGMIAILAVRVGLSRSIRAMLVEGPEAVAGPGAALAKAREGFWPIVGTTLVCGIAVGVGCVFCVLPGLAAAFLLLAAPYLVAIGASDFGNSFKRSYELVTRSMGPLIGVLAIVVVGCGALFGITFGIRTMVTMTFGLAAGALTEPLGLVLGEAAGLFWWPFVGAALVTAETAYTGVPLRHSR